MNMMFGVWSVLVCTCAFAGYQTGFEPPAYTVGNLHGQDNWVVQAGSADVQTQTVRSGLQAARVSSDGYVTRAVSNEGSSTVWVESYLRATPSTEPVPDASPRSASLYFDETRGIMCLNGNGAGGGTWMTTGVAATQGSWYRITIRLDFRTRKWDCFVNGTLRLSNLGFKDNSVAALSGVAARAQSGGTTYLDDVRVDTTPPAGIADADSDGLLDNVEAANPPGPGQSNRYLADSDGDGLGDAVEDANRNGQQDSGETGTRDRDSDDDGLLDGIEVLILGSNPLDPNSPSPRPADADSDTLPQGSDLNEGNPDVDGDRFDDGYEAVYLGVAASGDGARVPVLGDLNVDGFVTNLDALVVQSLFLQLIQFADWPTATWADVDSDGTIGNLDALVMHAFFLHLAARLPLRL